MEKKEKKESKDSKDKKEKKDKKDSKDKRDRKDSKGGSDDKHKRDALLTATWSVPAILPGPNVGPLDQTSLSPPDLATYTDNNIYLSFRASSNDAIWINYSSNGQTWLGSNSYVVKKGLATAEEEEVPGPAIDTRVYTLYRPSMTTYSGFLYLAFTNKADSNIVIMRNSSPTLSLWSWIGTVPIPALASSGPSIAAFNNGLLYLAYTDNTNKIQVGNFNISTNTWSSFTTVKDSGGIDYKTIDAPCLWAVTSGSINYRVYICFRSVNITYIGYANLDSNGNILSWTPQTTYIVAPFSIIDTPQVAQYNNSFYMTVAGPKNNEIKVGTSADEGATWGTWTTIDNSSNGSPTLIQFGSQLNMSFSSISQTPSRAFVMTTYATFS